MRTTLTGIALALVICLALTLGIVPGVSAGDTAGMVIDATPKEVEVNETFTLDIKVTITGGEEVDTAGAYLDFNTTYLEVLSITPGTAFTTVLESDFDNAAGTIDYVAAAPFGSTATSDFVLATVEFGAKDVVGTTPLTFVFDPPFRVTDAYFLGTDILDPGAVIDGSVVITGPTVGMIIDPTPKEVEVNETFTVYTKVTIAEGAEVDTAGAHLNFDTSYLEVLSITPGTAFTTVLESDFDNSAGTLDYTAGAPFGTTATSDFVLATVQFHAKAATPPEGTPLTFVFTPAARETCAFFAGAKVIDPEAVIDGSVIVCEEATLQGQVHLQGRPEPPHDSWITDLTVTFIQDTTVVRTANVTTDNVGNFTITDVDPGTYDIGVKSPRALSNLVTAVEIVTTTPVDFGTLREGDANNDDAVTAGDYSLLHAAFGSVPGDPNWNDNCDFNRNGAVEAGDYSLLHANFGQTGDLYGA